MGIELPHLDGVTDIFREGITGLTNKAIDALGVPSSDFASGPAIQEYERQAKHVATALIEEKDPQKKLGILKTFAGQLAATYQQAYEASEYAKQAHQQNHLQANSFTAPAVTFTEHLEQGGDPNDFGWQDGSTITVLDDFVRSQTPNHMVIGPLDDIPAAKHFAQQALAQNPVVNTVHAFVITSGHCQLVQANRDNTTVFNPKGDGACVDRAIAKVLQTIGQVDAVGPNASYGAVREQTANLCRMRLGLKTSTHSAFDNSAIKDESTLAVAEAELAQATDSTTNMIQGLTGSDRLQALIESQRTALEAIQRRTAQEKADEAFAKRLAKEEVEPAKPDTSKDEAYARALNEALNSNRCSDKAEISTPSIKPPTFVR